MVRAGGFMRRTLVLTLLVFGCAPSVTNDQEQPGGACSTNADCPPPEVCSTKLGCVACDPNYLYTCDGNDSHVCNADGTVGDVHETCPLGCSYGSCNTAGDCDSSGVKLIYVVDSSDNLLSFDPSNNNKFTLIGQLHCPSGRPYPTEDDGSHVSHPFSMAVDRNGTAWVLYNSGEVFQVKTTDASCVKSGWSPGNGGYELFGMGYVTDAVGGSTEKLFIDGGTAASTHTGASTLASVDASFQLMHDGTPASGSYSPELTGTGDAKLYGYFPGMYVAELDKGDAHNLKTWNLPSESNTVVGWAFAQWGGKFYLFTTVHDDFWGTNTNKVDALDYTGTGTVTNVLSSTNYEVVGAGVSTCAPVKIN
jgi:hypothetical protein